MNMMIHLLKQDGRAGIVLPNNSLTGNGIRQKLLEVEDCYPHTIIRLPNSVFHPYATVVINLLFLDKGKPNKDIWYCEHCKPEGYKAFNKTRAKKVEEFDPIKKWWNEHKKSEVSWKANIKTINKRGYDLGIKNPIKPEEEKEYNSTELMGRLNASFEKSHELLNHLKQAVR